MPGAWSALTEKGPSPMTRSQGDLSGNGVVGEVIHYIISSVIPRCSGLEMLLSCARYKIKYPASKNILYNQ